MAARWRMPKTTSRGGAELHAAAAHSGGPAERTGCERLIADMARSGLVRVVEATFEKDGREIEYRKVFLEEAGGQEDAAEQVKIAEEVIALESPRSRRNKRRAKEEVAGKSAQRDESVVEALRRWRAAEARKRGIPAFRIFADKVLDGLAAMGPSNEEELRRVPGLGPKLVEKYGAAILRHTAPQSAG
jgi:DNA topoisomerase-3